MKKSAVSYPFMGSLIRRSSLALLALIALAALAGCSKKDAASILAPTTPGAVAHAQAATGLQQATGPLHLEGTIGPGVLWVIDRPATWNGDLVVWLHGYSNPAGPIALPSINPIRDALLARGYAVITSSYSENGYAVKEATTQSHQLRGLFVANVAQPKRTYLAGVSLGGLVGALLAEKYPGQYDGSLLVSGVLGGSNHEIRYIGDIRVLFDAVYPGVLPGTLTDIPAGTDVNVAIGKAMAAIQANPNGLGIIAALARVKPEYSSGSELAQTVLTAIGFQLQGANDLLSRAHGHSFFDNHDHTYTGPLPAALLAQINASVARYSATPDAENYLQHYGQPTGDLSIPVISMHNAFDPVVPCCHEGLYTEAASAHGARDHLLQRKVMRYGHGAVTPAEIMASFDDLTTWVETGVKPAN